ncbi:MAG: Clp protease N-terminal domain-containing protein [Gemmatimonadales bacterium]
MICAREDNQSSLRTDHLVCGLLREKKGIAAQVLAEAGVTIAQMSAAALGGHATED